MGLSKIDDMRSERSHLIRSANDLRVKATKEARELDGHEAADIEKCLNQADDLKTKIAKLEDEEARGLRLNSAIEDLNTTPGRLVRDFQTPASELRGVAPSTGERWVGKDGAEIRTFKHGEPITPPNHRDPSLGRIICGLVTGKMDEQTRAAASTVVNSTGGYLVPDPLSRQVIDKARNLSVLSRLGASTVPMKSATLDLARVTDDPSVATKAENASFADSDITFDRVTLTSRTIGCLIRMSRELAEDGLNVPQLVENVMAEALASKVDLLGLTGDGGGTDGILGVSNSTGINEIGSVGAITYDDLLDALEDVWDANGVPNGIVTTPLLAIALSKLKRNSEANNYSDPPALLADIPMHVSNQTTSGELYIADWSQVLIGVRQDVTLEITNSGDSAFSKHQVLIKATWRGDVALARPDHFTKLSGATA